MDAQREIVELIGRKVRLRRREGYAIVVVDNCRLARLLEWHGEEVVRSQVRIATPITIVRVEELRLLVLSISIAIVNSGDACSCFLSYKRTKICGSEELTSDRSL